MGYCFDVGWVVCYTVEFTFGDDFVVVWVGCYCDFIVLIVWLIGGCSWFRGFCCYLCGLVGRVWLVFMLSFGFWVLIIG